MGDNIKRIIQNPADVIHKTMFLNIALFFHPQMRISRTAIYFDAIFHSEYVVIIERIWASNVSYIFINRWNQFTVYEISLHSRNMSLQKSSRLYSVMKCDPFKADYFEYIALLAIQYLVFISDYVKLHC